MNIITSTCKQIDNFILPHLNPNHQNLSFVGTVAEVAMSTFILLFSFFFIAASPSYYLFTFTAGLLLRDHVRAVAQLVTTLFRSSPVFKITLSFMGLLSLNYLILTFPLFAGSYWAWNTNPKKDENDLCYFSQPRG